MGRERSRWWSLPVLALVVVAGGCGGISASGEPNSAVTAAGPVPSVSTPVPAIVLGRDGLGLAGFGAPADEAIAAATAVVGPPDTDSGWVDPLSINSCAGTVSRNVSWGDLYLYFSDESGVASDERHFFAYSYGSVADLETTPEGLATAEGIGLGTTVEFLRAAYPDVVVEEGEEGLIPPNFYVDDGLSGRLTGGADDDLVTVIIGGDPCGVSM
jgi:hypothetical protein